MSCCRRDDYVYTARLTKRPDDSGSVRHTDAFAITITIIIIIFKRLFVDDVGVRDVGCVELFVSIVDTDANATLFAEQREESAA